MGYIQMKILGYFIDKDMLIIGLTVFFGLIFILTLIALVKLIKVNKKMKKLLDNNKGTDIVEAITEYYEKCHSIEDNFYDIRLRVSDLERESGKCIKKVGTLRYDAFGENNANLSFTAALLDESDSGFVLNGVYSRGNSTTYLKTIKEGKSIFALSDEEMQAISIAKENYKNNIN